MKPILPISSTLLSLFLVFAPTISYADSWDFADDPKLTKEQKQQKFEERKASVIQRMEDGKAELIERIDARIACAKNAETPENMRACHRTYSINLKKVHQESFQ